MQSRQASSNSGEGGKQSSLDDSGVVDDHEEGDATSEDVASHVNTSLRVSWLETRVDAKKLVGLPTF